jgi:hypothetical protein
MNTCVSRFLKRAAVRYCTGGVGVFWGLVLRRPSRPLHRGIDRRASRPQRACRPPVVPHGQEAELITYLAGSGDGHTAAAAPKVLTTT